MDEVERYPKGATPRLPQHVGVSAMDVLPPLHQPPDALIDLVVLAVPEEDAADPEGFLRTGRPSNDVQSTVCSVPCWSMRAR